MSDDTDDAQPRRLIFDARERVHEARARLRSQMLQHGSAPEESRMRFAAALLVYRDLLSEHRDDAALDPPWDERGVDWIERASRRTVTQQREREGVLPGTETQERNGLVHAATDDLLETADRLDQVAKDLGFSADTPDHQPHDEWDERDIIELLTTRDQEPAEPVLEAFYPRLDEADQDDLATDGGVAVGGGSGSGGPEPPAMRGGSSRLDELSEQMDRYLWGTAGRQKRLEADLKITVAANAQTGVGKTSLAVFLAYLLDTSPTGFDVEKQATLSLDEYRDAYDDDSVGKGSALIMDEAEQLDARRAMSDENVDASFTWQTRRIRQITTILTLPTWGDLDKRMREMTDIRIEILRRGLALVHERDRDRYEQGGIFWKPRHVIEWPDMSGTPAYDRLASMKEEFLGDEDGRKLLDEEEAQQRIEDATEDLRQDQKELRAKALYFDPDNDFETQAEVAEELGVSRRRVGQLVNSPTEGRKG